MRSAIFPLVIVAAVFGISVTARAQPVNGFYMSGGLGPGFQNGRSVTFSTQPGFTPAPPAAGPTGSGAGPAGQGSVSYGLGNGLRFEMGGNAGANRLRPLTA
jgi:OmpA-OmpF porin, OOP family